MHQVAVLVLPDVVAFDLAVPVQVFGHPDERDRYLVTVCTPAPGQAQFLHRPVPTAGTGLAATCAWAMAHLTEPLSVADLARHAGWAPRTFARRFLAETGTTPQRWITAQGLLRARHLLETSDLPVEQVAHRTGLGSAANLRLLLHRDTGTSPSTYRRTYRGNHHPTRTPQQ